MIKKSLRYAISAMALGGALLGAQQAVQAASSATQVGWGEQEIDLNGINARVFLNFVNAGVDVWNVPVGVTGNARAEAKCANGSTVSGDTPVASVVDDVLLSCPFLVAINEVTGELY